MQRENINPWQWQDAFGFSQAVEVRGGQRVLYCAGQAAVSAEGQPLPLFDLPAQINQCFDNLAAVLGAAGMNLGNVVRLVYYTTDVNALLGQWELVKARLAAAGIQPASSVVGVTQLAFDLQIEIEATAAD
ncbi:MAG TPA: RidA family protein [Herpetosiphonaceae bacterium]